MYIAEFEISNYKSYREPGKLEFKPGFNVLTGQNSAGKTAFLEAISLQFLGRPHRSVATIPVYGGAPPPLSVAKVKFMIANDELKFFESGQQFYVPAPVEGFVIPGHGQSFFHARHETGVPFFKWLLSCEEFEVSMQGSASSGSGIMWSPMGPTLVPYPIPPVTQGNRLFASATLAPNDQIAYHGLTSTAETANVLFGLVQLLSARIYRFRAERFNVGESPSGHNPTLASDATNLPEAMSTLQANRARFNELNSLLSEVLPQVRQVSVRPIPNNRSEVIVWQHDPELAREDLAIPLNQCGSGVGQVLAILYVIMTARHSQVIVIDELQSFLHPGAVRKLIEVLKRYPAHQYILATHSPTVISSCDPSTLTVTRWSGTETALHRIDPADARELQLYLAEIGARLSDVFGADRILWVEGQTEEICFPRIVKHFDQTLRGTAIVGIRETGDLEGRDAKKVFELYRRISSSGSLLPPALAFILDDEERSTDQKRELEHLSGDRVSFLPRRMYENYLLVPSAIAAIANEIDGFCPGRAVTAEKVDQLLQTKREQRGYYAARIAQIPTDWQRHIDGARVLREIFRELSETRVSFQKTKHSVLLTDWLLAKVPEGLREISDVLKGILSNA
jgi:hypothetical protein